MGLGSVLIKHRKQDKKPPKEAKGKAQLKDTGKDAKKKAPAPAAQGSAAGGNFKGSPLKVTIQNAQPAAPPPRQSPPVEIDVSPERKVLSVPSSSASSSSTSHHHHRGNELYQNLVIKKDVMKQQEQEAAAPSPVKKPQSTIAQTRTIPPLPLPPMLDDEDSIHTPPAMLEQDKPRPSIKDLPFPPKAPADPSSKRVKKTRGELKAEGIAASKKALILKRRAEITAKMPNWGDRCVDKYEIITQIGEGTYGQVYKAKCKSTGEYIVYFVSPRE